MSESNNSNLETKFDALEEIITPERERPSAEDQERTKQNSKEEAKRAHAVIEAEASSSEDSNLPPIIDERPQLIDHSVKSMRMRSNLAKVQTKLSPVERRFSKVLHQPLVQKVSESSANTIARPSGMLGGGIAAFVGCLAYQLFTRYYGLPYNFSFFILFFIGGFILGLAVEYLIRLSRRVA